MHHNLSKLFPYWVSNVSTTIVSKKVFEKSHFAVIFVKFFSENVQTQLSLPWKQERIPQKGYKNPGLDQKTTAFCLL